MALSLMALSLMGIQKDFPQATPEILLMEEILH